MDTLSTLCCYRNADPHPIRTRSTPRSAPRGRPPSSLSTPGVPHAHVPAGCPPCALSSSAASASAQTKWDLPAAYPASNFHTENLQQFAADVDKATGGKLKITVHANASLFKANEIKRAVQGNQAQAGEILLANFENENALFGIDGIPFLATGYPDAMKLYRIEKPALEKLLASQGIKLLYTVAWPPQGIYTNKELNSVADMRGLKWRAYSPATSKIAELVGAQPVTIQASELSQALATGVVDFVHVVGRDRLRHQDLRATQELVRHRGLAAEERGDRQPEGVRRARQAHAGGAAQGQRRSRDARLEDVRGEERLLQEGTRGQGHEDPGRRRPKFKADLQQIGTIMQADWKKKAGAADAALVDAFNRK